METLLEVKTHEVKTLLDLPKDFWQYMADNFIHPPTLIAVSCVCCKLRYKINSLDETVWKVWCFEKFIPQNSELQLTFKKIVKDQLLTFKSCLFEWNSNETLQYCKLKSMTNRLWASRDVRNYHNFLDFFIIIDTKSSNDTCCYKKQTLRLKLEECKERNGRVTLRFKPSSDKIFWFNGLEQNYSQHNFRIVSRRTLNGQALPTTKVLNSADLFLRSEHKMTLLSLKDRELLGEFFKKDKSYFKQTVGGKSINTDHARARNQHYYGKKDEDRLLRESSVNLQPLACERLLYIDVDMYINDLYDNELNLFKGE